MYICVVSTCSCPSQSAITVVAIPACSSRIAAVGQALLLCDTAARTLGVHLGFRRGVVPRGVTVYPFRPLDFRGDAA